MPSDEDEPPYSILAALCSFVLVWAIEIALARITSCVQGTLDIVVSGLALIILPVAAVAVASSRLLPIGATTERALIGLISTSPLVFVAGGIACPVALRFGGPISGMAVGLVLAIVLVSGMRRARLANQLYPTPTLVLGLLTAATAVAGSISPPASLRSKSSSPFSSSPWC